MGKTTYQPKPEFRPCSEESFWFFQYSDEFLSDFEVSLNGSLYFSNDTGERCFTKITSEDREKLRTPQ